MLRMLRMPRAEVPRITISETTIWYCIHTLLKGRLHGAFSMCVFMSDKPFDVEACDIGGHASATNGLSDMKMISKTHRVIDPLSI
jgi:hypothetical protein